MAFSRFAVRPTVEQLCRFWPLFMILFIAVLYFAHLDLSVSEVLTPGDANKIQSRYELPSREDSAHKLPHAVTLALVHYASTNITPQQTKEEIMVTANILSRRGPCNFLVFGLGFDSPLWDTLNVGGRTVFLEEDKSWIAQMAKAHPYLKAYHVNYTTMVSKADSLLAYARKNKKRCGPVQDLMQSNCKLALTRLPMEIYNTEWDVIMIDAPTGYFPEAPGRMTAIFSSAVMAKGGTSKRSTDILLHDVDRPVEKTFSTEFFCANNLIEAVGRLWHFQISSGEESPHSRDFCMPSLI